MLRDRSCIKKRNWSTIQQNNLKSEWELKYISLNGKLSKAWSQKSCHYSDNVLTLCHGTSSPHTKHTKHISTPTPLQHTYLACHWSPPPWWELYPGAQCQSRGWPRVPFRAGSPSSSPRCLLQNSRDNTAVFATQIAENLPRKLSSTTSKSETLMGGLVIPFS